jgi:hypothetical protein
MAYLRKFTVIFGSLVFTVSVAAAQVADCAVQVAAVIESAREVCSNLDINQLCYGSSPVNIQPLPNVRLDFGEPGDIVDPALVESFDLDVTDDSFGIAVTRFRTYAVDESVMLVAFGDVTVENNITGASDYIILPVKVKGNSGANVRLEPSPDAEIIDQLIVGQTVDAGGRTEDGTWLRLLAGGWVSADLMGSDYDLNQLTILPPEPHYPPDTTDAPGGQTMQSFRVYAEPDASSCTDFPANGVLAETPEGVNQAFLHVNALFLYLRGTMFIQGSFLDKTTITVLEGQVVGEGLLFTVSAGQQLTYWFDDGALHYEISPDYDYVRARYLPLSLLPREIELPFSLGGVIFPFTPGTGFLETIPADGTCTVVWAGDVNLRAGPGTDYPIRQGVPGGYYAEPDARAVGTDGRVWWRLADEIWIAADTTVGGGACAALPLVEPPPLAESG